MNSDIITGRLNGNGITGSLNGNIITGSLNGKIITAIQVQRGDADVADATETAGLLVGPRTLLAQEKKQGCLLL